MGQFSKQTSRRDTCDRSQRTGNTRFSNEFIFKKETTSIITKLSAEVTKEIWSQSCFRSFFPYVFFWSVSVPEFSLSSMVRVLSVGISIGPGDILFSSSLIGSLVLRCFVPIGADFNCS